MFKIVFDPPKKWGIVQAATGSDGICTVKKWYTSRGPAEDAMTLLNEVYPEHSEATNVVLGEEPVKPSRLSAAGRKKIALAQKRRWAEIHKKEKGK